MPIPNQDGTVTVMFRAIRKAGGAEPTLHAFFPCEPFDGTGKSFRAFRGDGANTPFRVADLDRSTPCKPQEKRLLEDCLKQVVGLRKLRVVQRMTADMREVFESRRVWLEAKEVRQAA